jgi:predicted CXXCH cytochrome family protein
MKTFWKIPSAAISQWLLQKPSNLLWAAGGGASLAVVLMSCATSRVMMAPPSIPGATFVGSDACATCHEDVTKDFRTADHAKLQVKGENAKDMGCESCHGPGSKHVEAGGGAGTIVNPKKSPETCFQCHLDKKAEFSMPYSHPVLAGKMSCGDCHDPHKGGTSVAKVNDTCADCHTAQTGTFAFQHEAVREGCSSCHNPHGSVNQKMLTERNSNLCLKCHFQQQLPGNDLTIGGRAHGNGSTRAGTCWSAGCHEAVHGSNVNSHFRN